MWFFYHKNRPELDMHFEHPSAGLFTSGIGGKGEIEFIRNNLNLNGLFVIYHGITDMLRVGDFSLYANGIGIVGIGELKTKQENGHLKVSASITSKVEVSKPQGAIDDGLSFKDRVELLKKDFPKLTEQIAVQDKLMKAKDSEMSSYQYASYEYNLINSLTTNNPITVNEDNSLLLFGAWSKYNSLFDILYYTETSNTPDSFKTYALKLMEPESPYNECITSEIDLRMHFPRLPILWWKIEDDICKDIYFKKMIVSTVLNPAKLIQHFVDEGFTVSSLGRTKDIKLEREIDGKHLEFGSLEAYFDLIRQSLMKTENVFSIVKSVINDCDKGKILPCSKIEMHIRQDNFGGTSKK